MSKIRAKDTKPELLVRKFLHSQGFRYRLHDKKLPGKPDIVLPKYNTVIEIHGCFWHGHSDCDNFKLPKTRVEYWTQKIENNKIRDQKNLKLLQDLGWKIITIYECSLKPKFRTETLNQLISTLKKCSISLE